MQNVRLTRRQQIAEVWIQQDGSHSFGSYEEFVVFFLLEIHAMTPKMVSVAER